MLRLCLCHCGPSKPTGFLIGVTVSIGELRFGCATVFRYISVVHFRHLASEPGLVCAWRCFDHSDLLVWLACCRRLFARNICSIFRLVLKFFIIYKPPCEVRFNQQHAVDVVYIYDLPSTWIYVG